MCCEHLILHVATRLHVALALSTIKAFTQKTKLLDANAEGEHQELFGMTNASSKQQQG